MRYTVRLADDTVGTMESQSIESLMGKEVEVKLQDENGMPLEVEGILAEILEESEF